MPRGDNKAFKGMPHYSRKWQRNNRANKRPLRFRRQYESTGEDKTGPEGLGPKTGRGAGYCAGYNQPGSANNAVPRQHLRRGMGGGRPRGQGQGRGRRRASVGPQANAAHQSQPQVDQETQQKRELNYLEREKEILQEELKAVQNRLTEIKEEQA